MKSIFIILVVTLTTTIQAENTGRGFKCHVNHTHDVPTSVHKLRPEDVKVIAGIGDSHTAGMGIYSRTVLSAFIQYRGHSFTMGGVDNLELHTTLPNILKKFNPLLTGYSTGISGPDGIYTHLNVAVVGEKAENMPYQARKLVARIKTQKDINFESDWKIVNVFVGGNDICDYCKDTQRHSPENYKTHLIEALDYIKEHMPRTFVNFIEVLDASAVDDFASHGFKCKAITALFCKCGSSRPRAEVHEYTEALQKKAREIVESGRYDDKDDFAVILQPFAERSKPIMVKPGELDMSYLSPDCFHFSAKGHAEAAVALWNNMMESVGEKQTSWKVGQNIKCPTAERPYICTKKNC